MNKEAVVGLPFTCHLQPEAARSQKADTKKYKTIHFWTLLLWSKFCFQIHLNKKFETLTMINCWKIFNAVLFSHFSVLIFCSTEAQFLSFMSLNIFQHFAYNLPYSSKYAPLTNSPEITHTRRKYHCTSDLLFDWSGFDQTCKNVVHST